MRRPAVFRSRVHFWVAFGVEVYDGRPSGPRPPKLEGRHELRRVHHASDVKLTVMHLSSHGYGSA